MFPPHRGKCNVIWRRHATVEVVVVEVVVVVVVLAMVVVVVVVRVIGVDTGRGGAAALLVCR